MKVVTGIDAEVNERLQWFLQHQAPKGMTATTFIEWAINEAATILADCEDGGDEGYCDVHGEWIPMGESQCHNKRDAL